MRLKKTLNIKLITILLLLNVNILICQKFEDVASPYSKSTTRFVVNLAGNWEKSHDGKVWTTVKLPASENFAEKIIYRRNIKIDKDLVDRYTWYLNFYGVNDQLEIYINEQFVGRYLSGMCPFEVRIPKQMIIAENNSIKFIITPASNISYQLNVQSLYPKKIYSGIIRDIFLIGVPQVWISEVRYSTQNVGNSFNLDFNLSISSADIKQLFANLKDTAGLNIAPKKSASVELFIKSFDGNITISQSQVKSINIEQERTETLSFSFSGLSVIPWTPDNPVLYKAYLRVLIEGKKIDERVINIGFKTVVTALKDNKKKIFLNGKEFQIKAVTYIEDYPGSGQTLSLKRMETDFEIFKTLGINTIRFKYSPPHPYMSYLCDIYGILMMIELPIYEIPSSLLLTDEVKVRMTNITKRYLTAYDNYVSLLSWGFSDGVDESEDLNQFTKTINSLIRESSNKLTYKVVLANDSEINLDYVDFIVLRTERISKSLSKIVNQLKSIVNELKDTIPIAFNYGILVQTDNHNGYSDPFSLEAQAFYLMNLYLLSEELGISGNIINTFNDYLTQTPILITNNDVAYLYSGGIVSRTREYRLAFSTLQALFNNEKKPLLNAGSYTEQSPVIYIVVGIFLGIILVMMLNRYRRFREYLLRSVLRPYNFYADIRDQRIISTIQTIILSFVISAILGIYLGSILYFYKTNIIAQYLLNTLIKSHNILDWLYRIIWHPEFNFLILTVIIFLKILVFAGILKLFSLFIKSKIYFSDTFTIVTWSGVPVIMLLPFAIILNRLLQYEPQFSQWALLLIAIISIWILFRMLKATIVVYDIPPVKVYSIGFAILLVSILVILAVYQIKYYIFSYLNYFFNILAYH